MTQGAQDGSRGGGGGFGGEDKFGNIGQQSYGQTLEESRQQRRGSEDK